jgi:hypothetical protein
MHQMAADWMHLHWIKQNLSDGMIQRIIQKFRFRVFLDEELHTKEIRSDELSPPHIAHLSSPTKTWRTHHQGITLPRSLITHLNKKNKIVVHLTYHGDAQFRPTQQPTNDPAALI